MNKARLRGLSLLIPDIVNYPTSYLVLDPKAAHCHPKDSDKPDEHYSKNQACNAGQKV